MRHFKVFILLSILFAWKISFGQVALELYSSDIKNDLFQNEVISESNGGFATKNIVYDKNQGTYKIVVTNFNNCNQVLWSKYIVAKAGPEDLQWYLCPYFTSVCTTEKKGFLISYTNFSDINNVIVTKLDSLGSIVWSRKINCGSVNVYPLALSSVNVFDDGYAILGASAEISHYPTGQITKIGSVNNYLIRISKNGSLRWTKCYSETSIKSAEPGETKVLPLKDKGFILAIKGTSVNIRTDSTGGVIWTRTFMGNYNINFLSDISVSDDRIYIYRISNEGTINHHIDGQRLIVIDYNGRIIWTRYYWDSSKVSIGRLRPISITILTDKTILLLSSIEKTINNVTNYTPLLIKTDSSGNLLNNMSFPKFNTSLESEDFFSGFRYANFFTYIHNNIICPIQNGGFITGFLTIDQNKVVIGRVNGGDKFICDTSKENILSDSGNAQVLIYNCDTLKGFPISDTFIKVTPLKNKFLITCSGIDAVMANLGNDTVLCSGKSYTLFKGANNNGAKTLWSTGDTTSSITVTKTGRYWLQLTHGYCISTDTVSIIFKGQLKPGLSKKVSICSYDSILLQSKDTAVAKYYWETPKKTIINSNTIIAKDSGNYYLKLTDALNCSVVDTVHVAWYPLPKAIAGPDTVLCQDQVYTMQGAGGITYEWIPAKFLSSKTDPHARASIPNTQQYVLVVSNQQGCRDTSKVLLKVRPVLSVQMIASNTTLCQGQGTVLKAIARGGDSLHYDFNWPYEQQNGAQLSIVPNKSGWYKIVLSDNCTPKAVMDSVYIRVIPATKAGFTFMPGNPVKTDQSVHFQNKSQNASSYLWNFGFNNNNSKEISPLFQYTDSGNYKVSLVAYGFSGCPNDTAYGYIHLIDGHIAIYIPNAFTPDVNGLNDLFQVQGTGIRTYSYNIYNRWGENIFHASNPQTLWDGSFKNNPAPEGVYLYQVDVTDIDGLHHYIKGTLHLIRD